MTDPKIKYDIEADVTGQEDAQALAQKLQDLGDVLGNQLAHQAQTAAQALQAISDKQAALNQFSALKNEAGALAVELAQAEAQLQQVSQQLSGAASATQGYVRAEMQARATLEGKQQTLAQTRQELQQLQASTTGAARNTDEYRQASAAAKSTIQQLTAEIALEKDNLKQAQSEVKAATREENALAAQRDKSAQALADTRGALQDNAAALAKAGAAAQKLGLDTSQLNREQAALAGALKAQAPTLVAVSKEVERLGQSQERVTQISKEMQEAARKLGVDGLQAPKALEQAFVQLGMSGVKPAHEAIQKLQIALAQIKASDVVDSQKQAALAAFNQKVAELRGQATAAAGATGQLGQAAQGAGTQLGNAAHKAAAWASALVGMQQLKSIATAVVDTGAQFEALHIRLQNLLGSTEAASQAFGMLKQLAASTPFDVAGLTESFAQLTAFGLKPSEAQMRSLADVAANLGGGTEVLKGITLALGQAWTKTKLQGQDIMQLAERGVPVWDALARATGRTVPELQRMSEAGLLGRDVIAKLIDELGRMNEGASDKLMRTYAGAVANAKDALAEFFDMVAKAGVLDWLTTKVRDLLAEFERMKQTGELQQKAKELADAFVALGNMAQMAAQAMVTLAPVIRVTVEAMIALKAVQLARALLGIATGAGAAATAVGAAGVAARVAAPALASAGAGAGLLATALRKIPGAALLIALGEGAAWLAGKFFGSSQAAKEAEQSIDGMLKVRPVNGAADGAQKASDALQITVEKSDDLIGKFGQLIDKGAQVDAALSGIGKDFDLSSAGGIKDAAVALDSLLAQGKITAEQFNKAWADALKGVDLSGFELRARAAMDGAWEGVGRLQQVLDAGLREAIRRVGGDFDVLSGGMGKASRSAISDVDIIIGNLQTLGKHGIDTGALLTQSLGKAISTADSQAAIDALRQRVEGLRGELGDKITDGLLENAKKKAEELKDALDAAPPGINSAREAMKALGITSDEELKKVAASAKEAYDTLANDSTRSARELQEAFKKAAQAAIDANNGVAPSWVQAAAAMRGYVVTTDSAGKSVLQLRDAITAAAATSASASGEMQDHWRGMRQNVDATTASLERYTAKQEQLAEGVTRLGAGYMNKDGMASDAKGNVQQAYVWTRASVIDFLKQAGLDEQLAQDVSKQFLDANGKVIHMNNPGQAKWGGKYGSLSTALANVADYYKNTDSGQFEAAQRLGFLKTDKAARLAGAADGNTYVSNITLNGATTSLRFADRESQNATEALLREFERAKLNTGR